MIEISLVGHLEATILEKLRCVQSQTETFYTQRVNQHVLTYNLLQQVLDIVKSHVQRGKTISHASEELSSAIKQR